MKIKRVLLILLVLTIGVSVTAKTTVTPFFGIEYDEFVNSDSYEKQDSIYYGASIMKALTPRTKIYFAMKQYDNDYFGKTPTEINENAKLFSTVRSKKNFQLYLYHQFKKVPKKTSLNLGFGFFHESDELNVTANDTQDYFYLFPRWSYKLSKKWSIYGNWGMSISNEDTYLEQYETTAHGKTTVMHAYQKGGNEGEANMDTGISYTGIKNYKIDFGIFNHNLRSIESGNKTSEAALSLSSRVTTTISGFRLSPWVRIGLNEWKYVNEDGEDISDTQKYGFIENKYGIDISKKIDGVTYLVKYFMKDKRMHKRTELNTIYQNIAMYVSFDV